MAAPAPNIKDSMKSTWRTADKSTWSVWHHLYDVLGIQPTDLDREVPVHAKTDKMAHISQLENNKFVFAHAVWPLLVHQIFTWVTGWNVHPFGAFVWYMLCFKVNAVHALQVTRELGHKHGFLDGDKHARDQIPDHQVMAVWASLFITSTLRPMMSVFLAYQADKQPISISWWLPVEIGLYGIILDFWFYWYHRFMHDHDSLWKFHRKHHLTKHPTSLLTLYADSEQEFFDVLVIPFLTWGTLKVLGFQMGFYDWWICHQYVVYTELWGHSGVRLWITPPTPASPFLRLFDAELTTEDHDLHHRKGWKKSHNYGKQTLLWDKVFGTALPRIESVPDNIDWNSPQHLPLLGSSSIRNRPK